jgi:hypothetical protein
MFSLSLQAKLTMLRSKHRDAVQQQALPFASADFFLTVDAGPVER